MQDRFPTKGLYTCFAAAYFVGAAEAFMFARKRHNRPMSYICSSYAKEGRTACTSHSIREKDLCEVVLDDVAKLLDDENMVNKILQKIDLAGAAEDYQNFEGKTFKTDGSKTKAAGDSLSG